MNDKKILNRNTLKKNHKTILIVVVGMLILLIGGKLIYDIYFVSPEEKEALAIDTYNFKQLEKVKEVLKDIPEEEMEFRNLNELNRKYNAGIVPKENCFYTVTTNVFENYEGDSSYIFGFQLESERYKKKYGGKYYAYPKYDLPERIQCFPVSLKGLESDDISCGDMQHFKYTNIISSPCSD